METELEKIMLEAAIEYLQTLDDRQFLAISCNLQLIHDGIIRIVHNHSLRRAFRAPNRVTADVFLLSKKQIGRVLRKKASD